ncbi:class I SAM-dependent methyltransferase [Collinsella stercoris]|uniref:class I SAM-dependent methyltransferase n=1 Tax=Collinsella stercoris TaxID=147206 RepID=UPI003A8CB670
MDTSTIQALIALNNQFYAQHAASFAATRSAPWHGWSALADLLREHSQRRDTPGETSASNHVLGKCDISGPTAPSPKKPPSSLHALDNRRASVTTPIATPGSRPALDGTNDRIPEHRARTVLDLACGNLRFEEFLACEFPHARFSFNAVDTCPALASPQTLAQANIRYREVDILQNALAGHRFIDDVPICDLAVCFGFMHHVPSHELRSAVLETLCAHTAPHCLIVVSFWQFMYDERLARKAMRAGALSADVSSPFAALGIDTSQLEEHDHFLGWQTDPSPLRYCHHFPEAEVDELVASVGTIAREVARYSADGSSGTLNRYLVLEKL